MSAFWILLCLRLAVVGLRTPRPQQRLEAPEHADRLVRRAAVLDDVLQRRVPLADDAIDRPVEEATLLVNVRLA